MTKNRHKVNVKKKRNNAAKHKKKPNKSNTFQCPCCRSIFKSMTLYRDHLQSNHNCHQNNDCCCKFCDYVGLSPRGLQSHIRYSQHCSIRYDQLESTKGKLQSKEKIIQTSNKKNTSSDFVVETIDHNDNIIQQSLRINHESSSKKLTDIINSNQIMNATSRSTNNTSDQIDYQSFIQHQRTIATLDQTIYASANKPRNVSQSSNLKDCETSCEFIEHESIHNDFDSVSSTEISPNISETYQPETSILNVTDGFISDIPATESLSFVKEQKAIQKRLNTFTLNNSEIMQMDLFHLLKASNCPMVVYDRIIDFIKRHEHTIKNTGLGLVQNRDNFIRNMNTKLYSNPTFCKPQINQIQLSSQRRTTVVTFLLKDYILKLLTNPSFMNPEYLLLNPNDPCTKDFQSNYYGDLNSGSWHKDTVQSLCSKNNHLLMPFIFFIDGLKVDKYGKLTVEAVLSCCSWFKRKARNRSSTWWVPGFVQDQKLFRNQDSYVRDDKAQDYHDMLRHIFQDFKEILSQGGLEVDLIFSTGQSHRVILLPVIQFIIGDCKGNDLLCGRMGGHNLQMKGLCRDCNISPHCAHDIFLDRPLLCDFYKKSDFTNTSKELLLQKSFLPIKNCFNELSFGACDRGIYGATPAEILHAIQLGLCEYCADAMDFFFTKSSMDIISHATCSIVSSGSRQSLRDLPDINPFKKGLMSVKSLKAKERFARVYCAFLTLSNSFVIKDLTTKRRKKCDDDGDRTPPFHSVSFLSDLHRIFEETICFHEWMKSEYFLKKDFEPNPSGRDSRAMRRVKEFLIDFSKIIKRGGNNLKTPKMHQMLHVCDFIMRHGSPLNCDGSRGEYFGKTKIKDNAQKTNKQRDTLNFDISRRIAEEDVMDSAASIYYRNTGKWISKYCEDTDLATLPTNRNDHIAILASQEKVFTYAKSPRFYLVPNVIEHDSLTSNNTQSSHSSSNEEGNTLQCEIKWNGGKNAIPLKDFCSDIVSKISSRLYIGCPSIGGKVRTNQKIPGYTEVKNDDVIYRCHPSYGNKGEWFDWAYFLWEGYDDPIPAKILMILDLSNVEIIYDKDNTDANITDSFLNSDESESNTFQHLTNEVWVVVQSTESVLSNESSLSIHHFQSKIYKRTIIDEDNLWFIPLNSIRGPCAVFENNNYSLIDKVSKSSNRANDYCSDKGRRECYIMNPKKDWVTSFLPSLT